MPASGSNENTNGSPRYFYQKSWVRYASILMVVLIFGGFWLYSESLISSIESLRAELAGTRSQLASREQLLRVVGTPGGSVLALRGQNADQHGTAFFDSSAPWLAIQTFRLSPTPKDSFYTVWGIFQGRPAPLGTFSRDSADPDPFWAVLAVDSSMKQPEGCLISLESVSHASLPSGRLVLRSTAGPH